MSRKLSEDKQFPRPWMKYRSLYVGAAIIILFLVQQFLLPLLLAKSAEISYSDFKTALRAGDIASVTVSDTQIAGTRQDGTPFFTIRVEDPKLLLDLEAQSVAVQGQVTDPSGGVLGILLS